MTIAAPGWTFEAQLEQNEFDMLWLNTPNLVTGKRQGRYLLSAVLKIGWRRAQDRVAYRQRVTPRAGDARGAWVRQPEGAVTSSRTVFVLGAGVSKAAGAPLMPRVPGPSPHANGRGSRQPPGAFS